MTRFVKARRTGSFLLPVLVLAAILAFSGCGGDEDSGETVANETAASAEAGKDRGGNTGKESRANDDSTGAKPGPNAPQPEGEEEPGITPEQESKATTANITLESPAFQANEALPVKYTCDGEGTWPPLHWKGLPPDAEELVLLVLSVDPVNQKLLFDWAVAGLDPSLASIEEGKLPEGAVVGENSFDKDGYEVCPAPGTAQTYIFMLFAIPTALDPSPGFEARAFREEVLDQSGNVGLLNAAYKR